MGNINRRGFLKTASGVAGGLAAPAVLGTARAAPSLFKLYMLIPNNQPARMIWGTLAAQQISKLGVDVVSSYVDFPTIIARRSKGEGKTHVDGGWDPIWNGTITAPSPRSPISCSSALWCRRTGRISIIYPIPKSTSR